MYLEISRDAVVCAFVGYYWVWLKVAFRVLSEVDGGRVRLWDRAMSFRIDRKSV